MGQRRVVGLIASLSQALFRFKNVLDFDTVALLFLFDKYYPIMEQLGLKDSSRDL
jgi:hypothetical protein